tara:strand:- start:30 stop:296 length:267 start_codon:yes stop_codon:yes gene_type:complete
MYQIVVFMFLLAPGSQDALTITHLNGEPLSFKSKDECYAHIYDHTERLKEYASSQYDGAPVKSIDCFTQPSPALGAGRASRLNVSIKT